MIRIQCEACGSSDLKKSGNRYICDHCGSKYFLNEEEQEIDSELTDIKAVQLIEEAIKLHKSNDYAKELSVLNKAYNLDNNNSVIMNLLGRCFRSLGNSDKALEYYNKSIEINPYEGLAYTNMGTVFILREEYEKADQCYKKGLPLVDKSEFDYWIAYANHAIAVAKLGDKKLAEQMIKKQKNVVIKTGNMSEEWQGLTTSRLSPSCLVDREIKVRKENKMKKAILILDAQMGFLEYKDFNKEIENIKKLIDILKDNNDLVISTRHIEENEESMIYKNSKGGQIEEEIKNKSDYIVEKYNPNAFKDTNLQEILDENSVNTVIVVGFNTEYCALFNTIALQDRGFKAIYIEDAISTVNDDKTYTMPGLDINDFVSTILHWSGAIEVLDLDEYLDEYTEYDD